MHRHSGFVRACAGALVLLLAACGPAHGPGPGGGNGGGGSRTVHLRGTAYKFGRVHTLLAGATIRVAEDPDLQTVVAADGTYTSPIASPPRKLKNVNTNVFLAPSVSSSGSMSRMMSRLKNSSRKVLSSSSPRRRRGTPS